MLRSLDYAGFCRRCRLQGASNWTFSEMHPVEAVREWAGVDKVAGEWQRIEPRYAEVIKAGRDLDLLAQERVVADLPLDELTTGLLHRAYFAAFAASRIKGSAEQMGLAIEAA
jgi:hypothetical protein